MRVSNFHEGELSRKMHTNCIGDSVNSPWFRANFAFNALSSRETSLEYVRSVYVVVRE